jgi:Ni,Fe-hydrogenase III large subunit
MPNAFQLSTHTRIITLCAPLEAARRHWLTAIAAARVALRFQEIHESLRLLRDLLPSLPEGPLQAPQPAMLEGALGLGQVEGWRGPVLVALEAGPAGSLRRVHPQDPSWLNWPVLEHAIIGNIVPDFPLINKSFNLSYSGVDL